MTGEEIQEWWRRRALCCHVWGCPPWEFDAAWESEKILLSDVQSAIGVAMVMAQDPVKLAEWLTPGITEELEEAARERRARQEEARAAQSWPGILAMMGKEGDK